MIIRIVFLLTIFASLMSQLPVVLDSDYDGYLKAMWLIPFAFLGIFKFKTYMEKPLWFMYIGTLCMLFYCAACEGVTGRNYMNIDLYNMSLSLMIGITSYSLFRNYYSKTLLFSISIVSMIGNITSVGILVAISDWCASRRTVSLIRIGFFSISAISIFTLSEFILQIPP